MKGNHMLDSAIRPSRRGVRRAPIAAVGCALVAIGGCPEQQADEIVFGAALPLTGDQAVWGQNTRDGIELGVAEINAGGGVLARPLRIQYEDTRAQAREGVSAIRKLISVDGVAAVIDDSVSTVTLAMAPIANDEEVVLLATGATAPAITNAGEFVYRIWNSDTYEGEVAASFVRQELDAERAAVLYIDNDYGHGLFNVFGEAFAELGGQIVGAHGFESGVRDLRSPLTQLMAQSPDLLYVVGYPREIPLALRQAAELGATMARFGTVAMEDPAVIEAAGAAAEGLMFPYPLPPDGDIVAEFHRRFEGRYGRSPGITADVGYDAVQLLAAATQLAGELTGDEIRRALDQLGPYAGVSGVIDFDGNGDVRKPLGIRIVQEGEFHWRQSR